MAMAALLAMGYNLCCRCTDSVEVIVIMHRVVPLILALASVTAFSAAEPELSVSCGAVGRELDMCREAIARWTAKTGHTVAAREAPDRSEIRLAYYQKILAEKSTQFDILTIDVIWSGVLAPELVDLTPYVTPTEVMQHIPIFLSQLRAGKALVALPWFMDAGLLYYRRDLLAKYQKKVPEDVGRASADCKEIQAKETAGNKTIWWFTLFQGKEARKA